MKVEKLISLNENVTYPNCYQCNKELSPYLVREIEPKTLKALEETDLIIDYIDSWPVALFCKDCCKIEVIKNIGGKK